MKLISCPDCTHQVSRRAVKCPRCGCPVARVLLRRPAFAPRPRPNRRRALAALFTLVAGCVLTLLLVTWGSTMALTLAVAAALTAVAGFNALESYRSVSR